MRSASGFTLFELVVVILIVSILVTIGIPSFKYVTTSNRIATEVNGLLGDMRYARTEALRQGLPVTVCASTDTLVCSFDNTKWHKGWIVFSDPNGNQTPPAGTVMLRIQPPLSTAFNSTDTLVADNAFSAVTFNREGFGAANTAAPTTVTMELQSNPVNSSWTRCLVISPVGALSIQKAGGSLGNCT